MTEPKPDFLAAAHRELNRAAEIAKTARQTGVLVVELHVREGSPNALKVRTEQVVTK